MPPGPPWNAEVTNTTVLMFAGCPSGVLGAAGCLVSAEVVEFANGNPIVLGAGLAANNPFIQFAAHPLILYTITVIGPGSPNTNCASLSVGNSCALFAGSPLILTDAPAGGTPGTTLSFAVAGTVTDGAGTTNWIGIFSAGVSGNRPQELKDLFCPLCSFMTEAFTSGILMSDA